MNDYKETKKIASKKKTLSKINLAIRVSIWLCLGISGALIVFCGTAYVVNSKLFEVQDIEIKGNAHMDRDEVLAMLNLEEGDNILGWDMDAARLRLLTHPWIKDVGISRSFIPAGVGVRIVEHRPTATLMLKDKPYLISEDGVIFASAPEDHFGLMIQAREYEPLHGEEDLNGVLKSAMRAVSIVEAKGLKVRDLVIEAGGVMNIRLDKGITLVILGEMTPMKVDMALKAMREIKPVYGTVMDLTCEDKIVLRNRGGYGSEG
ncbi:MAG: cell division protein FtsQ [Deltaproteobacteria bacterium ADurb.BinA179]|jgi:cell division septal protein FtsQ|nr:MAG: cell division protein FtsQ [Deltaproteobacteria bacterium ADurb.BinA179]HNU75495.1 FtsQ-type POTRA domain-containing protein [Deltaproteobacteria bacterium]HOD70783.1 FtsQ-type POTRA domain-containing protein [Deltaproteobacteria bacterium]HOS26792.1 FtsQ-type POTRA domain-containing protein [Deltaproteobacteria bacterium]HPA83353.1 FtsQ-type POTRA domain-containing protein [Deltaproteobacteria bacterium]